MARTQASGTPPKVGDVRTIDGREFYVAAVGHDRGEVFHLTGDHTPEPHEEGEENRTPYAALTPRAAAPTGIPDVYDPKGEWYWVVGEDDSNVYSTLAGKAVPTSDAKYAAWHERGNRPSRISPNAEKPWEELFDVLLQQAPQRAKQAMEWFHGENKITDQQYAAAQAIP